MRPREAPPKVPGSPRNALRVLLVTASEEELRAFGLALHRDDQTVGVGAPPRLYPAPMPFVVADDRLFA